MGNTLGPVKQCKVGDCEHCLIHAGENVLDSVDSMCQTIFQDAVNDGSFIFSRLQCVQIRCCHPVQQNGRHQHLESPLCTFFAARGLNPTPRRFFRFLLSLLSVTNYWHRSFGVKTFRQ